MHSIRPIPPKSAPAAFWTLIPTSWESLEARTLRGWSIDKLAARASVLPSALTAYETAGDVDPIGGPGLMRLRRAFEAVGIVFDEKGLHELERPAPRRPPITRSPKRR